MRVPQRNAMPTRSLTANERGAVLGFVVLMLVVFLGLAAFSIDLGMLYVARGEAQRAADAGAHAGGAYMIRNFGMEQDLLEQGIKDEAVRVAQQNLVRGGVVSIDLDQDDVEVLWDEEKVRVHVHRTSDRENPVRTLFARVLGFNTVDVGASAASQVWPATASDCVLPFAIPDRWCIEPDGQGGCLTYSDGLESSQGWEDDHFYVPWEEGNDASTGYGDDTVGAPIVIKPQSPQGSLQPGWYFPFRIPGNQGGADYRASIHGCTPGNRDWGIGSEVYTEPGNMVGPTQQGFGELIDMYPDAEWDDECNCAVGDPEHIQGRTRPVVLFDPEFGPAQGMSEFTVINFAALFIEGMVGNDVQARFVTMTALAPTAERGDGARGSQLKILRIVE